MHKQMQTKTEAMTHTNNWKHYLEIHTSPHTYSIPLGQTVFVDNFVIICFGFTQAPVWCSLLVLGVPGRLDNHKSIKALEFIMTHLLYSTCVKGNLPKRVWIALMC